MSYSSSLVSSTRLLSFSAHKYFLCTKDRRHQRSERLFIPLVKSSTVHMGIRNSLRPHLPSLLLAPTLENAIGHVPSLPPLLCKSLPESVFFAEGMPQCAHLPTALVQKHKRKSARTHQEYFFTRIASKAIETAAARQACTSSAYQAISESASRKEKMWWRRMLGGSVSIVQPACETTTTLYPPSHPPTSSPA